MTIQGRQDFAFVRPIGGYTNVGYVIHPKTDEARRTLKTLWALTRHFIRFEDRPHDGTMLVTSDANANILAEALMTGGYGVTFEEAEPAESSSGP